MKNLPFLEPHLEGERFKDHSIPLEILKDLSAFEDLIVETAKWLFLQTHSDRQRTPRGFTDGVSLKLSAINEGSAIPVFVLTMGSMGFLPSAEHPHRHYYEQAREYIIETLAQANTQSPVSAKLPDSVVSCFERLGKSLREDESIILTSTDQPKLKAKLDRTTRRKILLSSSQVQSYTEDVILRGQIPELDQKQKSATILLADGISIPIQAYTPNQAETLLKAFNEYSHTPSAKVWLQGTASYDRRGRIQAVVAIEHLTLLDPLDIDARLEELALLKDGWLEGKGVSLAPEGLRWLSKQFAQMYDPELPLPYIYPTAEGGVQAEWPLDHFENSLEIDLMTHQAEWQSLDMTTDEDIFTTLDLDNPSGWQFLQDALQKQQRLRA
jgi:hypothetical protein